MHETALEVLWNNVRNLASSLKWLSRSYATCLEYGLKQIYNDDEFDDFENLTSRYARTTDLLINKVLRSIDYAEFLEPGSPIDSANRAEKRGLIESVASLRDLKDLRNEIAHEYDTGDLGELFGSVLEATPLVLALADKVAAYCRQNFPVTGD